MSLVRAVASFCLFSSLTAAASGARSFAIDQVAITLPENWRLHQSAKSEDTLIMGFEKDQNELTLFVKPAGNVDFSKMLASTAKVVHDFHMEPKGDFTWKVMETSYDMPATSGKSERHYVTGFQMDYEGKTYVGYASSNSTDAADRVAYEFLEQVKKRDLTDRSLTGEDYHGAKYYIGFGSAMSQDPVLMKNEVKYDVLHTHDIFTKGIGGDYLGTKFTSGVKRQQVLSTWSDLAQKMTSNDMFVQYTSGHGSKQGLEIGVSYDEIRDNALSYPAKEIIIFAMACYSGHLVDSFNKKKSVWQNWQQMGRTLMVLASSKASQTSSTGPSTDVDEPNGPKGSAGSAFGYSLWKGLIGYADGFVDGVKDGFISLEEIQKFTTYKTQSVGHHSPVVTGTYHPKLIMNRVPPKAFLDQYEGKTSESLSDEEVMEQIQQLDSAYRL